MKKFMKTFVGLAVCVLMLAGCGGTKLPEVIETDTISIDKNGKIVSYVVEEFNKDYYNVSELNGMAISEAAGYNAEHQTGTEPCLKVEKVELLGNDKVMVQQNFDSAKTFADYNKAVFFYGTVKEAIAEGFDLATVFANSNPDGTVEAWIAEVSDKHIVITDQKAEIYCPYEVSHYSEGAMHRESGCINSTNVDGLVYILMKK